MPLACWPVLLPSPVQIFLVRHVRNKNLGGHLFPHSLCIGDPRKRLGLSEQLAGLLLGREHLSTAAASGTGIVVFMRSVWFIPLIVYIYPRLRMKMAFRLKDFLQGLKM